jgi:DNA repair protein RAD16
MTRRASLRGQRGTKRSADDAALSEDELSLETSDAAIAHALQMEEYEQPAPKKQKTAASKRSRQRAPAVPEIMDLSSDSELSEWDLIEKSLSSEEDLYSSAGSFYETGPRGQSEEQGQDDDDDDDSYDWDAGDRRRREENQADLPPSWDEQRKARRVSLRVERFLGKMPRQLVD